MEIESQVKKIMLDNLDVSESDLVTDAKLRSDLGATSIEVVEIVASLENEFDVEISDQEAQEIRTYGELLDFIKSKKS